MGREAENDRPLVAVLDAMPEGSRSVIREVFGKDFRVVFVADESTVAKRRAAAGASVLLTMWGSVDAATIAAARGARLIQKLGVGTDKIDVAAAAASGIAVLRAAGINAEAVAELTVLLTLAVARNLPRATASSRSGKLVKEALRTESYQLFGKTVGLLGFGHIGQAVARRFAGFGVQLVYHDIRRAPADVERDCGVRYVALEELRVAADVISLHLPATPSTNKIIDAAFLAGTRPGLILVNTARGSLVDEPALIAAIEDGRVLGAGLDVTEQEPLPVDSPLLRLDRVVLTPHVGGAVANNFPRVIARAYRNARAILDGTTVDPADVVAWPSRSAQP